MLRIVAYEGPVNLLSKRTHAQVGVQGVPDNGTDGHYMRIDASAVIGLAKVPALKLDLDGPQALAMLDAIAQAIEDAGIIALPRTFFNHRNSKSG